MTELERTVAGREGTEEVGGKIALIMSFQMRQKQNCTTS